MPRWRSRVNWHSLLPCCAQGKDYPLHYAAQNKASEAVVMALLGTRPKEIKKSDEVRAAAVGAHASHSSCRGR